MLEMLKEKFEKIGYGVKINTNKFEVFERNTMGNTNSRAILWCDGENAYGLGDRDQTIAIFHLGSLENNIIGLYLYATNNNVFVENELLDVSKEIIAGTTMERISEIFLKYLGTDFISNKINYDVSTSRSNAFNYVQDGESHLFNYIVDNKYITVANSRNINFSYQKLLIAACLRKQYEELLSKEFPGLKLDEEMDLNMFSLFYKKTYPIIKSKDKMQTL